MQYINVFALIKKNQVKNADPNLVTIPKDMFHALLVTALRVKNVFDEKYYVAAYPDIKEAIRDNRIESAADHYFQTGYFEGRVPKKLPVDDRYYREKNPDVAESIRRGEIKSCQKHFECNGFSEGRLPYEDFSLF